MQYVKTTLKMLLLLSLCLLTAGKGFAQLTPVTSDLWDVSQGNVVTNNSPVENKNFLFRSDARNMFGQVLHGAIGPTATRFADAQPQGFVHFVEWMTPRPIILNSFVLNAAHDGPPRTANQRGFRRFTLFARDPVTGNFAQIFEIFPSNPYGNTSDPTNGIVETNSGLNLLRLCANIASLEAQEFRAEFEQFGPGTCCESGPRIVELDGFDTLCPGVNSDTDGDGVPDEEDLCPGFDDRVDADFDTVPDGCDACPLDLDNDADGDGFCGDVDVCPGGDDNQNADGDGLPDFCDGCPLDPENDADGDGLCESDDNCPTVFNDDQTDTDGDLDGDACDLDDDDDGVDDDRDNCPLTANPDQANFEGDSVGDVCDPDDDNDGVPDIADAFPFDPTESADTDGDGVGDNADPCPTDTNDLCVFPNQGQCISSRLAQECGGLTGQARAACNKEQRQLCQDAF